MTVEACQMCDELEAVRQKACVRKVAYGARSAREVAEDRNREVGGRAYQPYRCPFDDHFHVGHVMSWEGVEHLAALLRHRSYPGKHSKGDAA